MHEHVYAHILLLSAPGRAESRFRARLEELGHRVHVCDKTGGALRDLLELDIDLNAQGLAFAVRKARFKRG